jgi:hypothetical protein
MSWFAQRNVDDIPDNPNELPNNTYKFRVISAVLKPTQPKQVNGVMQAPKTGITFKYQIVEGSWANFFPLSDWVRVPDENCKPDEIDRMLSYLKMRLLAFGFTPDEIQDFGPGSEQKCVNKEFYGTTSAKKDEKTQNINIKVVKFDSISDGVDSMVDFGDDPDM